MTYAHAQSTSISIVYHCQFVGAKKDMYIIIIIILIIIKIIYTHMFIIIYVYPIWGQFWFSFCCSWPDNVTWLRPFMDTGADQLCHKTETWRWLASPARSTCRPYILHPKCKDANPVGFILVKQIIYRKLYLWSHLNPKWTKNIIPLV